MRVVFTFIFVLLFHNAWAQKTVITTNSLPLGIKVRKAEFAMKDDWRAAFTSDDNKPEEFYDIATLCDGFNDFGIPKNLVIPPGAQIILFLPSIKKNRKAYTYSYYTRDTDPARLNNYNYVHNGDSVGFLGARMYSPGASERIKVMRLEANFRDGQPSIIFRFSIDQKTPEILGISSTGDADELILQYEDIDKYEQRQYALWQSQGHADSLDQRGLPTNLSLPASTQLTVRTSTLSEAAIFRLYNKNERSLTLLKPWEHNKSVFTTSSLPPGNYQFVVEEPNKKYGDKLTSYSFTIEPEPLSQLVFWLLIVIGVLIVSFIIYRIMARRKLQKMEVNKKLMAAELKAIRAQLNPHFLFNSLNAIQNLVNKSDKTMANDYIAKLSKLMRLVLNRSAETFHSLRNELEIAETYLDLESLRSEFSYNIHLDNEVDKNMLVPSMLLQPYLENAVIHGINAKGGDAIEVEITLENELCHIYIRDNGKGKSTQKGNGKGMTISHERLKVIENSHGVQTSVNTKEDENGYHVSIQIPTDL